VDLSEHAFPGRNDLWLVNGVVVRRHDNTSRDTVEWIHRFLAQLAFNASKPVPYFEGYSSVRPLSDDDRAAVVAYLRARGRQIITKQAARGVVDDGPTASLNGWIATDPSWYLF